MLILPRGSTNDQGAHQHVAIVFVNHPATDCVSSQALHLINDCIVARVLWARMPRWLRHNRRLFGGVSAEFGISPCALR